MKKQTIFIGILLVLFIVVLFIFKKEPIEYLEGKHNVIIDVKDYGKIELELDADKAPITVTNFISLVESGVYSGSTFHRIIEGFMAQGGIVKENVKSIKGEFKSNGVINDISHIRGVISMARTSDDKNSASSQFFIVHKDSTFLDGDYAAFGIVTKGMDVVDKINEEAKPIDNNGGIKESEQPVITSIKVVK